MPSQEHDDCCDQKFEQDDEVRNKQTNKLGYVVRTSPLGSQNSVVIQWDGEDTSTAYFGNAKCANVEKTGNKRVSE